MIPNPFRKFDLDKMRRSSDQLNQTMDFASVVSKRLMVFAIVICVLFGTVFIRLFQIQVLSHEEYTAKTESYNSVSQSSSTPRGEIYDRNGNVIARTVVSHNIIYTQPESITTQEKWELAKQFAATFDVDPDELTLSQRKDLYIFLTTLLDSSDPSYNCNDLLTDEEQAQYASGEWGDEAESRRTQLLHERITSDMLDEALDDEEKAGYVIYSRMVNGTLQQSKTVLEDVDDEKVAVRHTGQEPH